MAKFEGYTRTISKVGRTLCVLLVFTCLTGCSMAGIGNFRPEINLADAMLLYPELLEGVEVLEGDDGSDIEGTNRTPGSDVDAGGIIVADNPEYNETVVTGYSPIPYDVVASSSYTQYLEKCVTGPMKEKIAEAIKARPSLANQYYFRVFHIGQESDNGSLVRSSTYNHVKTTASSVPKVGGSALTDFAYNYLCQVPGNQTIRDNAINNFKTMLAEQDQRMNYDAARISASMPSSAVNMWGGGNNMGCEALADLVEKVDVHPEQVLPNLKLTVVTGATTYTTVALNDVSTTSRLPYQDGVKVSSLVPLFTTASQFDGIDHDVKVDRLDTDSRTLCWSYIDNYSTTIVMLASAQGYTLKDIFGDSATSELKSIVSSVKNWSEVDSVQSELGAESNVSLIEKGFRGS